MLVPIAMGGALGALGRFFVQEWFARRTNLPGWLAILVVNLAGSLLVGFLVVTITQGSAGPGPDRLLAAGAIGFCGSFTTFSTFSLDSLLLLNRSGLHFLANVFGSMGFGMLAVIVGMSLGRVVCG